MNPEIIEFLAKRSERVRFIIELATYIVVATVREAFHLLTHIQEEKVPNEQHTSSPDQRKH